MSIQKYQINKENAFFLISIFLYILIHFVIRLSLSETIQVDDSEQIFYGQNLQLGYPIPQPPLYT